MNHACELATFDKPDYDTVVQLIEEVVKEAHLRRESDFVSRVFLLTTPHFGEMIEDLAHACISRTNCLNVWGGAVSGLLYQGSVYGHEPAVLIAIFGEEFEPAREHDEGAQALKLCLAENDQKIMELIQSGLIEETEQPNPDVDQLGLLSYGANYAAMPRIELGRICHQPLSCTRISVNRPLTLNSEGLEFFTDPLEVTECNGLFLIKVNGEHAASALKSPDTQTKPVGLRLQVMHEHGETWIPVLSVHADGTMGLASPVAKGQKIRLARRTPAAVKREVEQWKPVIKSHFGKKLPKMGLLMAGFERSEMCHSIDDDVAEVLEAFPDTEIIGLFGQACWLGANDKILTPPRNNRLSLCLFNPNT